MNENIIKVIKNEKEIYLIKTAHISNISVEDVKECFEIVNPDTICIELDEKRYESITNKNAWRETDLIQIIKKKQVIYLLVNTILASFQRRMANNINAKSGGEMLEGINLSINHNKNLVLADRSIKTTFSRIWKKLYFKEKIKLIVTIISSIFENEEIKEEDLSHLKEADSLEIALQEIGKGFPNIKKVLVDERDQYLSYKIINAPGNKIMAIIGAAHAKGIIDNFDKDIDLNELDKIPETKLSSKLIKWFIPLTIISMIIITLFNNKDVATKQLYSWILWNGSLSAIGVLIARGHILSILTAFIMAPITSLNPLLAAGFFAGIVEATIKKPKVKDFEDLAIDTQTLKGFFKNSVTRILLIVIFANIFSSIATIISGLDIFNSFINLFK